MSKRTRASTLAARKAPALRYPRPVNANLMGDETVFAFQDSRKCYIVRINHFEDGEVGIRICENDQWKPDGEAYTFSLSAEQAETLRTATTAHMVPVTLAACPPSVARLCLTPFRVDMWISNRPFAIRAVLMRNEHASDQSAFEMNHQFI